jgi:ketosteroid isomerase-like protein
MYHAIVRRRYLAYSKRSAGAIMKSHWPALLRALSIFSRARTHWAANVIRSQPCGCGSQRLFRLLPHLAFNVKHIAVSGSPWNTTIVVEWRDTATLPGGTPYVNDGVRVMRMRWGKVTHLHAYLDTEIIALAFRKMAAEGIEEAEADLIRD